MDATMTTNRDNIITLTGANHWKEVLESPIPFLVEIGADWCGTCDIMAPILERLAIEYEGKIRVGRLDIDTNEQVAREFGVTELPFLLLFKDGNLVDHVIGMVSATNLKARIQKLLEPRD